LHTKILSKHFFTVFLPFEWTKEFWFTKKNSFRLKRCNKFYSNEIFIIDNGHKIERRIFWQKRHLWLPVKLLYVIKNYLLLLFFSDWLMWCLSRFFYRFLVKKWDMSWFRHWKCGTDQNSKHFLGKKV
jgi:hypothetical protein